MAEFLQTARIIEEQSQLLRILSVAIKLPGRDANQANFLLHRKTAEQATGNFSNLFACCDELSKGLLLRMGFEIGIPQFQRDFAGPVAVLTKPFRYMVGKLQDRLQEE